eukprot:jgi/Botrbrau1/20090/Bobra.0525s0002.1
MCSKLARNPRHANLQAMAVKTPHQRELDVHKRDLYKKGVATLCFVNCILPAVVGNSTPFTGWDVTLLDEFNSSLHSSVSMEVIAVRPKEEWGVGFCVGVLYSKTPQLMDSVDWWSQYNISKFYMYIALYSEEEWVKAGMAQMYDPVVPISHHLLDWKVYIPFRRSDYHGFVHAYSDCLYRHRQEQEFLIFHESDELLLFHQQPPKNLLQWLQEKTPPNIAGICTSRSYEVNSNCSHVYKTPINARLLDGMPKDNRTAGMYALNYDFKDISWIERNAKDPCKEREKENPALPAHTCHSKCIIRPQAAVGYEMHYPFVRPGWGHCIHQPHNAVTHFHVRCFWNPQYHRKRRRT